MRDVRWVFKLPLAAAFVLLSAHSLLGAGVDETSTEQAIRIAIIGSGISGAATGFFLREQFPDAIIDVFERDARVGGRIQSVSIGSHKYEAGASVIHDANRWGEESRACACKLQVIFVALPRSLPLLSSGI